MAEVVKKAKQFAHRVVVVDGFSEDDTCKMALESGAEVIFQEGEGKGMALRTIFNKVDGDIYVVIDGDATYDALEMGKVVQPLLEGEADMVIGSRLKGEMEEGSISRINKLGNRLFNYIINSFFDGKITDSQSGFRAMSRKAVESLNLSSKGFEVETEMTVKALKQGLRVSEIPITYRRRRGSPSKLNSFKAGSRILRTIFHSSLQKGELNVFEKEVPRMTEDDLKFVIRMLREHEMELKKISDRLDVIIEYVNSVKENQQPIKEVET